MQLPFDDEEEQAREIEEARRMRNTPSILQGEDEPIGGGDSEPGGGLLEALKMMYGTDSSQPMSMRARRPNVEEQMQAEAKGLMGDEAKRGSMMANQPRDPEKERAEKQRIKAMLGPKGPVGPPKGQDNFATPTPTALERSKVSGAMMLPPVQKNVTDPKMMIPPDMGREAFTKETPTGIGMDNPDNIGALGMDDNVVRVTPGSYYDDSQPIPARGRDMGFPSMPPMGPEQAPPESPTLSPGGDYGLDLPEMAEQEVSPLSDPGPAPLDPNDPRERLKAYLSRENSPEGISRKDRMNDAYITSMRDTNNTNSDLGYMNLLMASANKAGTIGGVSASNDSYDRFTKGQMGQNEKSSELLGKVSADKQKQQDEKLKGMMALAKMKQDEEKYQADLTHRGNQLSELAGYHKDSLDVQRKRNELDSGYKADTLNALRGANDTKAGLTQAQIDLLKQKTENLANPGTKAVSALDQARIDQLKAQTDKIKNAPPKAAELPLDVQQKVRKMATDNAARESYINKMKRNLQEYRNAKDKKAKVDFGKTILKDLNSEGNPDAVGTEEAKRFGSNLDAVRLQDVFAGENPFGQNFQAFDDMISAKLRVAEGTFKANQSEIDKVMGRGGPGGQPLEPLKDNKPANAVLAPGMKWQVNTKTGARRQVPIGG